MKKYNVRAKPNRTSRFIKAKNANQAAEIWFSIMEKEGYHLEFGEFFTIKAC